MPEFARKTIDTVVHRSSSDLLLFVIIIIIIIIIIIAIIAIIITIITIIIIIIIIIIISFTHALEVRKVEHHR